MPNIRPFEEFEPLIDDSAWVDPAAIVIGNTKIGKNSSVWPLVTIRGDIHEIRIGESTNIQDNSVLHVSHDSQYHPGGAGLYIGNGVTVGHQVTLHGCTIGDHSLIGISSVIMDHAVIENHVMIGAGSLVTGGTTLKSGFLYVGRPVKKLRKLTDQERQYLEYSAGHYVKLAARHRKSAQ